MAGSFDIFKFGWVLSRSDAAKQRQFDRRNQEKSTKRLNRHKCHFVSDNLQLAQLL